MYWKIRFRVNKSKNSPISTIRIDAENLRQACVEVVSLYRDATILEYQDGEGRLTQFNLSDIGAQTYPIDPNDFLAAR
jgi:hypothetical protein